MDRYENAKANKSGSLLQWGTIGWSEEYETEGHVEMEILVSG